MKPLFHSRPLIAKIIVFVTVCGVPFLANYFDNNRDLKRKQYERHLLYIARSTSAKDVCKKSGEAEADSPEMAALQEFFMTADPALDRVPAERLFAAKQESDRLKGLKASGYQLQWEGTSSIMGGRTRAIMWDPNIENKAWAGGVTGGLWYNDDVTSLFSQWEPVNDFWSSLSISSIVYDPVNPMTFYVGTGEVQTALITLCSRASPDACA